MTVIETLKQDLTVAMKEQYEGTLAETRGARMRLNAIRNALKSISDAETSGKERKTLNDAEVRDILRKNVKKLQEAADIYDEAGSPARAEVERAEAEVLSDYLPKQADEAQTREAVTKFVEDNDLAGSGMKNMKVIMGNFAQDETYDKSVVSKIARELLT